jgi:hypothetical protein
MTQGNGQPTVYRVSQLGPVKQALRDHYLLTSAVMTKRRLLCWSLTLLTFAAFAVWLEPTRVVWGWLRGDAFYQGRPTSWWREVLRKDGEKGSTKRNLSIKVSRDEKTWCIMRKPNS